MYVTLLKGKLCAVICDILFFDGETNVQNAGSILAARYPCIYVGPGAEYIVTLFFPDVFYKTPSHESLINFTKRFCNIFGSTRHATTETFNKYSNMHNREIKGTFIKSSGCR